MPNTCIKSLAETVDDIGCIHTYTRSHTAIRAQTQMCASLSRRTAKLNGIRKFEIKDSNADARKSRQCNTHHTWLNPSFDIVRMDPSSNLGPHTARSISFSLHRIVFFLSLCAVAVLNKLAWSHFSKLNSFFIVHYYVQSLLTGITRVQFGIFAILVCYSLGCFFTCPCMMYLKEGRVLGKA